MRGFALLALLGISALLLTGCSSYNRQWRAAVEQPIPADTIAGPWEGRWISDVNSHQGRLRCILTPVGDNAYEAAFHAKFWKIFSSSYIVPLHAEKTETNAWRFSGESNLGKLAGGVYSYEGAATPLDFFSTYLSKYDHGKFEMSRPLLESAE